MAFCSYFPTAVLLLSLPAVAGAGPAPETVRAFEAYSRLAESRLDALTKNANGFLWADTAARRSRLRQEGVICEPRNSSGAVRVPRGLVHDWVGAAFIPGATTGRVLELLQDYDHHRETYRPDVIESKTLARNGNDFQIRLRVFKRKVVTVVLDTDSEVHYRPLEGHDWQSRSFSTRIVEIANPGTARERALTAREDHGYLWRLDSYWLLRERDGGVYLECEVVSLSRSVPAALAWLIDPIIRSLPKDTLENTLRATRSHVIGPAALLGHPSLRNRDVFMTLAPALRLESEAE